MAESRVTTFVAEVLGAGVEPNARVTTLVAEALPTGGVPNARVTGLVAEVLHGLEALTAGRTGRKLIVVVVAGEHESSTGMLPGMRRPSVLQGPCIRPKRPRVVLGAWLVQAVPVAVPRSCIDSD
jgi:hypothetical protein